MANWVRNRITILTDKDIATKIIQSFSGKDAFDGTDREFTFNAIIPMPEKVYRGELLQSLNKDTKAELKLQGIDNWYDWCSRHWGTKWDIDERTVKVKLADNTLIITFDTANRCPKPIIEALTKKFPNITLICEYSDEDAGYNCGKILYNGRCIFEEDYSGTEEGFVFYLYVHDYTFTDYINDREMSIDEFYSIHNIFNRNKLEKLLELYVVR